MNSEKGKKTDPASEKKRQSNLGSTREQIAYLIVFILFILISMFVDRNSNVSNAERSVPLNSGWQLETGETADLDALPEGVHMLTKDVSALKVNGKALCLKSIDTVFSVYADGELLYDYHPVIPKRLGLSYGMFVHAVAIPENTAELSIQAEPVFPSVPAYLVNVRIEDSGEYMTALFRDNLLSFGMSAITLLIGLLFFVIGSSSTILMRTAGIDFIAFGTTCALIGFVGFNDTLLLQVLTGHPALIRVVTYVCLMFLPFPALSFLASATGHGRSKLVPCMLALCTANFVVQVFLTYRGVTDYYYLVNVTHLIIVLDFMMAAWLALSAFRQHTIRPELLHSVVGGMAACVIGAALDLMLFHFFKSNGSSDFTRIGVLIFTVLMGIFLLREQIQALKQKQQESMTLIGEISEAFARVIDIKDSYTNGHSSRVAKYTAMLSRELGYDEETVEQYYRIALLHDVGKIGVPKSLLNKPGKLTKEEYDVIKTHTSKGYDALKDISIMPELATGARSHHERPDGKGYPQGLSGDEIPRVAQIIAVADCFDAMYSNRPYRNRMDFDRAVSIIKDVSGTQLTTDVVEAFLRLVERGEFHDPDDHGGGSMEDINNIRGEGTSCQNR